MPSKKKKANASSKSSTRRKTTRTVRDTEESRPVARAATTRLRTAPAAAAPTVKAPKEPIFPPKEQVFPAPCRLNKAQLSVLKSKAAVLCTLCKAEGAAVSQAQLASVAGISADILKAPVQKLVKAGLAEVRADGGVAITKRGQLYGERLAK